MIDEQIAARAARGDRQALERLCALTWRQLFRFVYYRVQNREEAEDVTQEAYSRMLRSGPASYSAGEFMRYLECVALNVIRDRWRQSQTRSRKQPLLHGGAEAPDAAAAVIDREVVMAGLSRLREELRQVLELRLIAGLSTAETARRMGRTEAAVRSLQYRAVQALKEEIG